MKKLILSALIAFAATNLSAQTTEMPKNILSVRGGVTVTNFAYSDAQYSDFTKAKAGFQIEVVDQIRLSKTIPLYLETGIFAAEKGSASRIDGNRFFNSYYYVGVPLTVNYRWAIAPKFTLDPQLGLYYAFLAGASSNGLTSLTNFNGINRSDVGLRVAVGATYNNRWSLRVGYDLGFIPIMDREISDMFELPHMTNGSFFVTLGINFITIK